MPREPVVEYVLLVQDSGEVFTHHFTGGVAMTDRQIWLKALDRLLAAQASKVYIEKEYEAAKDAFLTYQPDLEEE